MISSTSNAQMKHLVQMQKKAKLRKEEKAFVIEGTKMFEEALQGNLIKKAYFSESYWKEKAEGSSYLKNIQYEIVTDSVFKEVSDTMTPQGVIAIVQMPQYNLEKLIEKEEVNLVLLENLRDPGNLGTIVRTAEGAGMDAIILSKESVDIYNPKVIRSTMGAIYRMPIIYVDCFSDCLINLQKSGIVIYAAHLKGKNDYDKESYAKKMGLLIGNEANGLTEEVANLSNCLVKIPMEGKVESLNAAVATALLMYEVYRQRRK